VKQLVIVESPFKPRSAQKGSPEWDVELGRNIAYARAAMRDSALRGEAPYASHLLLTQEGILDDEDPGERMLGIEIGLAWGDRADKTVVYADLGITRGMEIGIERAQKAHRPVEIRHLSAWSTAKNS
jgi:hypothetical protein